MNIHANRLEATVPTVLSTDVELNDILLELVDKQVHGAWAQQVALEYHENGHIKTNLRLDTYETTDCTFINGYIITELADDAKSLVHGVTKYHELTTPVVVYP